jgi:chromosome segregation ATPase
MSDELVKRLREDQPVTQDMVSTMQCALQDAAADRIEELDGIIRQDRERIEDLVSMVNSKDDRIEELEADLRKMALDYLAAEGQAAEAYQAQLEAEAKLSRAVEGLQHYACDCVISCEQLNGSCGDMARTTLAELKGENQ